MLISNFNQPALYSVDVSSKLGKEYVVVLDDITRMLLIQFTIQLMFYLSTQDRVFFSDEFVLLVLYIVLGVCLYWLVFRNLVRFT